MLSGGRGYKFFYYAPGVVILLLSMFALYSAAHLMETRRVVRENYTHYAKAFMDMDYAVQKFEKSFLDYVAGDEDASFSEIKKEFINLNGALTILQEKRQNYLESTKGDTIDYELTLYSLRMEMLHLADALNSYKKWRDKNSVEGRERAMYAQHDRIEGIRNDVIKLKDIVVRSFVYGMLEGRMKEKEKGLYWLIFIIGFCGFILLVTNSNKLKELEQLHSEKKETLDLLEERLAALEAATDGIFIINAKGEMTYLNSSFYILITGGAYTHDNEYRRKMLVGKSWREVFSRSDVEVLDDEILPVLRDKGVWAGPFQMFTRIETSIATNMSLTRLPEGGLIGTLQDMSYKKQAEQEKRQLEDQFYQAQKMEAIGRLAGGIAHDFNNILAAMNGYAEFLVDDLQDGTAQYKFAESILKAGRQARALVDQMLAFSRRSNSDKKIVDIRRTLEDVIGMFSITLPKTVELHTHIASDHVFINGNPTQISQMIMNLCVNALDAIEEDRGQIRITMEKADLGHIEAPGIFREKLPDPTKTPYLRIDDVGAGRARMVIGHMARGHDYVKISVQDTGTGMSRAIMEHIFEPFFTTKPVDKGSGLGLATVHGVLAAHHGFMILDSEIGSGTRFDIYFPVYVENNNDQGGHDFEDAELDSSDNEIVLRHDGDGLGVSDSVFQKEPKPVKEKAAKTKEQVKVVSVRDKNKANKQSYNILLVEDQENVREMIVTMIERLGHNVSTAISGMDGLDKIRENPKGYDLVITDHNMPKMTGLEMVHQVSIDLPDLRFVLLSGYSEARMQEMIEDHPSFKAILRKPVSQKILDKVIRYVVEK